MPENEFEKKVSSEMQELRFKPSEKVWVQVEERIRKKKKRRVFIILFFLAGLALLGYWQRHKLFDGNETAIAKTDTLTNKDKINSIKQDQATNNKEEKTETPTATKKDSKEDPITTKATGKNDQTKSPDDYEIAVKPKRVVEQKPEVGNFKEPALPTKKKVNRAQQDKKRTDEPSSLITKADSAIKIKDEQAQVDIKVEEAGLKKEETKVPEAAAIENKVDSIQNQQAEVKKEEVVKIDSLSKELLKDSTAIVIQPKTGKKWKFGIEFTPGISSLHDEILSLNTQKSADLNSIPQTGSGFPLYPTPPSERKSSFAFQAGAFAKKQLTQRSALSIGLRYAYYSDRIAVGRDSLLPFGAGNLSSFADVSSFYRASNSFQNKTNGYHFIELPVNYHLRLNKNDQKPIEWNVGLILSRLVASNALMYDTILRGIYYRNNHWLNKTQLSLSSGLSFAFINNKNFQWSVGPMADLHLNSLFNSPYESRKYLLFVGLRSRILFDKKK